MADFECPFERYFKQHPEKRKNFELRNSICKERKHASKVYADLRNESITPEQAEDKLNTIRHNIQRLELQLDGVIADQRRKLTQEELDERRRTRPLKIRGFK